ncbi:hypothetical protein [Brevibacterium sp.]|uniref:hypothetical protein n=1 Tax=Brevibacterium sp. TaxID=1701 RepID=UPI0025BE8F3E|nr:hypothetical protein [Brevibacterium sp.]
MDPHSTAPAAGTDALTAQPGLGDSAGAPTATGSTGTAAARTTVLGEGTAAARSLDLSGLRLSGAPLSATPLNGGDDLVLMGRAEDVTAVLRAVAELPGAREVARPEPSRLRVGTWLRRTTGTGSRSRLRAALRDAGLSGSVTARTRLSSLDTAARTRLLLAAVTLTGTDGISHLVLPSPLAGVPGHLRSGLRTALLRAVHARGLGAVLSTDSPVDAVVTGARIIELDAEQVAQAGDARTIFGMPRGGLSAALGGANVMSGLARKGWLSIGHSQVRRRTELDGKVYLAIPTDAVTLSLDEFDPAFSGEAVFEVLVVGVRDEGSTLQVRLSPVDTEAGLPLVADVLDASPRRAWQAVAEAAGGLPTDTGDSLPTDTADGPQANAAENRAEASGTADGAGTSADGTGWALLHPGLGGSVPEQLRNLTVGARLWAEVDTERIHVWPVEE